jgi:DNA-3-methyladenine glycosylase
MSQDLLKLEPLEADWYARSTLDVAHELLGKILFVKTKQGLTAGRIVETEAYRSDDPASHSSRGKTPRASLMFGDPGVAYVYFIYGMYEMLNFVTEPHGEAGAVLIRGVEPVLGEALMRKRRKTARTAHDLTGGPGKLCRAMGIEMKHNGASLLGPEIWVAAQSASDLQPEKVRVSPRIGISVGQDRLWRFYLAENKFVSRSPMNQRSKPFRSR